MNELFSLIALSIVIEAVITYVKTWFVDKNANWQQVTACIFGVLIALAYEADLLAQLGITSEIPFIGNVLTGIILSRGSNYLFDLVKKLNGSKDELTVKEFLEENSKG